MHAFQPFPIALYPLSQRPPVVHQKPKVSWFYLGNPTLAYTHLEHTIALYDPA
jgi:hypothetical protein